MICRMFPNYFGGGDSDDDYLYVYDYLFLVKFISAA